jgi:hypothetical protein
MSHIANIQAGRGPGSTSRSPRRWAVTASLAAALLSLAGACAFPGQKLLVMTIRRGPEVILTTQFDVVDSSSLRDIWDAAGEVPVSSEANPALLVPTPSDALAVALVGVIDIQIRHVRHLQDEVAIDGLTVVRSGPTSSDWRLPPGEIERVKKLAGL